MKYLQSGIPFGAAVIRGLKRMLIGFYQPIPAAQKTSVITPTFMV